MEDNEIIALYFSRNESAIKETEEKYGRLCHSIAYNILFDKGECEECVNDTLMKLWSLIPPNKPNSFKAFIARVARNLSLKRHEYNSAKCRTSHATVSFSELESVLRDEEIAYEIEDESLGEILNEFLRTVREDVRNVFIRRYYFYDGISDIAKMYGFTTVKVKSMLFHTRNKLRGFLKERGVYL